MARSKRPPRARAPPVMNDAEDRLTIHDDAEQSDHSLSQDDVEVYALNKGDEDADTSENDEEEESDARLQELERQERFLRKQLQIDEQEDSDSSENQEDGAAAWGARRKAYYGADEASDEDELGDESKEAQALQKRAAEALDLADFEVERLGEPTALGEASASQPSQLQVEGQTLQHPAALLQDASEVETLLTTLKVSMTELRFRIGPLLKEVRSGQLVTAEGLSFLETKNLLLLQYCINLVFYLLMKLEGKSVQDHPVASRLLEIRLFMEKLRPLDKKLQSQVEKLTSIHQPAQGIQEGTEPDATMYRPNLEAMAEHTESRAANDGQKYQPPKRTPTSMDADPDKGTFDKRQRVIKDKARKAYRSALVQELAREIHDMPEEVREVRMGEEGAAAAQQRSRLEQRAAEEEDLMMRIPLSKKELKALHKSRNQAAFGSDLLDDSIGDVADLLQADEQAGRQNASQRFGVDISQSASKRAKQSGDADLPGHTSLADKRVRHDNAKTKRLRGNAAAEEEPAQKRLQIDAELLDEDYGHAKKLAKQKKEARAAQFLAAPLHPPRQDEEAAGGHRKVSSAIEKNRGLTPHRKRDSKNPRVKGRRKFEKAKARRSGQVVSAKPSAGAYAGETTGIKTTTTKSRRL